MIDLRFSLLLVLAVLVGGGLVLWLRPGIAPGPGSGSAASAPAPMDLVLAVSWEPAFCEGHAGKPECRSETPSSYEATHLALHGLWPQGIEYCGVDGGAISTDRNGNWRALPAVSLDDGLWSRLAQVMPGTQSALERHEWLRHGTCFGTGQPPYFTRIIELMDALNTSAVGELFTVSVGRGVSGNQIRAAFNAAFGSGAGSRVSIDCATDGSRRLVTELQVSLRQVSSSDDLSAMLQQAAPVSGGCADGLVDPVGPQ